jgi:hypothetical protein
MMVAFVSQWHSARACTKSHASALADSNIGISLILAKWPAQCGFGADHNSDVQPYRITPSERAMNKSRRKMKHN